MLQEHERGAGAWQIEWVALPEIFLLASGALSQAREMISGIVIDPQRLQHNLEITNGLILAEAVMMGLAPHLGREKAHDLVYAACRKAIEQKVVLIEVLAEIPEIQKHLKRAELEKFLDPANYLGCTNEFIDRVLRNRQTNRL
jgi:3-carboxy-cis,cis-muconate cycloisomerase